MHEQPDSLFSRTLGRTWDERRTVLDVLFQLFFRALAGVARLLEIFTNTNTKANTRTRRRP